MTNKHKVIFTGKLNDKIPQQKIFENLAGIFKSGPDRIRKVFSKKGNLVLETENLKAAHSCVNAVKKAGALCIIEELVNSQNSANEITQATCANPPIPPETSNTASALELSFGAKDITTSPQPCTRFSGYEGGINNNRQDSGEIPFEDILLISVFRDVDDSGTSPKLLLFARGSKRPYQVEANAIVFANFPGVGGINLLTSLRNFVRYLRSMNPGIFQDIHTDRFASGQQPYLFTKEITILTTALQKAMDSAEPIPVMPTGALPPVSAGTQADEEQSVPTPAPPRPVPTAAYVPPTKASTGDVTSLPESTTEPDTEQWSGKYAMLAAIMLFIGFCFPLLKPTILFGTTSIVWPWNLMGLAVTADRAAAMATLSSADPSILWALIPLIASIVAIAAFIMQSITLRAVLMMTGGYISTALILIAYQGQAEIYGILFLPPTVAGGAMMLLFITCAVLLASTNHLRKSVPGAKMLRIISGISGGLLAAMTGLSLFAMSTPGWESLFVKGLFILITLYGAAGLKGAFGSGDNVEIMSIVIRSVTALTPVFMLIAQLTTDDPFSSFVVSSGGGLIHATASFIKYFLIMYGATFMWGAGLTALLEKRMYSKIQQT